VSFIVASMRTPVASVTLAGARFAAGIAVAAAGRPGASPLPGSSGIAPPLVQAVAKASAMPSTRA
jgi:hypothetical protein